MRVTVLTNMWPNTRSAGSGAFVAEQVRSLRERGLDITVVAKTSSSMSSYGGFFAHGMARTLLAQHDLIHAHYGFHSALPALVSSRAPLVTTFHRGDALDEPYRNALYGHLQRRCVRHSAALIAVSTEIACALVTELGASDHKVSVIPCGVDTRLFRPATDLRPSPERRTVLWSGSPLSVRRKGLDVVLEAARALPALDFWLIGVERAPDHPSNCRALGRVPNQDVPALLGRADLFLAPTRSEGTPVAVLEAMACASLVAVSPVGGVPDVLEDGRNGFLLASWDPNYVASRILEILSLPSDRLRSTRECARATVCNAFSLEQTAAKVEAVFATAVRSRRVSARAPGAQGA